MSDTAVRFWGAVAEIPDGGPELLPTTMARAAVIVLPADGVGLSVVNDHYRVPLGASDDDAVAAERLQFTVGEGPCLQAISDRAEVRASGADLARRWPAFYDQLTSQTPYRSIASMPLRITPTLDGAIDLYFNEPTGAFTVDLDVATDVAEQIVSSLRATSTPTAPSARVADLDLPSWLYSPNATSRLRTWIAAGVIMYGLGLRPTDAMARIRGYAYANERDITQITDAIIDGTLSMDALAQD